MVLKLYGVYASHWVRLVAAVLHEKQVPFELVSVHFANKEKIKSPEYLEKHPYGQVPYIVCDCLNFFCLPAINILVCDLIRTMTASSSTKAKQYAII
jgi:Glutathione S-transferase, N-terminal domain